MFNQHSETRSDEELWLELKKGKKNALRSLFLRHHDSLHRYGLAICSKKLLVEDCLQELFFRLWKKHTDLSDVQNVKGYLWISFRRRLMKRLKKKSDDPLVTSLVPRMKTVSSIEQTIIRQEQQGENSEALYKVIDSLTQREREVIFLKYYEGMSYTEIEEILGVEYQTVRNYVYRAIKRLRDEFKKEGLDILSLLVLAIFLV